MAAVAAMMALSASRAKAGPGFLTVVYESTEDSSAAEEFVHRKWLKFSSDFDQTFYIFRPVAGPAAILDPANNTGPDPIIDDDIYQALTQAVEQWTEPDSELRLSQPLFSEDGAVAGIPYLEYGPYELALDTRNLITFRDGNNTLGDGILFTPVYFTFQRDYEINLQENPETQALVGVDLDGAAVIGTFASPGDALGDGDGDGFSDLAFLLKFYNGRDVIKAGELIECDILMNQSLDWNLYPPEEDLVFDEIDVVDTLGTLDIWAAFTKAVGRGIGLAESHLYETTLAPVYITRGDINDEFAVNPFEIRELSIDDKSGVMALYDGEGDGGTIAGQLLDGGTIPLEFTIAPISPVPTIQDHPVYAGRPFDLDKPLTLDVVFGANTRFGITEPDAGLVELQAHMLTGHEMRFSQFTDRDGVDPDQFVIFPVIDGLKGDYKIPGLPAGDDWYMMTTGRDEAVSYITAFTTVGEESDVIPLDDFFRVPVDYPNEFFGGVDPNFPLPGFDIVEESDPNDDLIRGEFLEFLPEIYTLVFNAFGQQFTQLATNGQFSVGLPNSLLFIEGRTSSFSVGRLTLEADNPTGSRTVLLDNRDNGFGGLLGDVEVNENDDFAVLSFDIVDTFGTLVGAIEQRLEIISAPGFNTGEFGPVTEERALRVSWTYTNLDGPRFRTDPNGQLVQVSEGQQQFGFAHLYQPTITPNTSQTVQLIPVPLFANGQRIDRAATLTGSEIPGAVYWDDAQGAPLFRSAIATNVPGVATVPDELVFCDMEDAIQTQLWDFNPTNIIDGPYNTETAERGVLLRYEDVTLDPGESVTFSSVVAYELTGADGPDYDGDGVPDAMTYRKVENGFAPQFPNERFADQANDGFPLVVAEGRTTDYVNIITNTATRTIFAGNDRDLDGVPDDADNCPFTPNADQQDADNNGIGDACEGDYDNDGVTDPLDNCPETPNAGQGDQDLDGDGDACDEDIDGDGVPNEDDNCVFTANPGQEDANGDGIGDICDNDRDGDGVPDKDDNCPDDPNPNQEDTDGDGYGDVCDNVFDTDGDGILDPEDNCPFTANPDQSDIDDDGLGDVCDSNADGDAFPNALDNCPLVPNDDQLDSDNDGIGDVCDDDRDGDGIANGPDNCPDTPNPAQDDADGDGIGDLCDEGAIILRDETGDRLPPDTLSIRDIKHGDLNNDGYMDLVVGVLGQGDDNENGLQNRIYINLGFLGQPGVFEDWTFGVNEVAERGDGSNPGGDDRLPIQRDGTFGVVLFDFDLDGDLDIFFSSDSNPDNQVGGINRLLINVDEDRPSINPFADDDDVGDGFFIDYTEFALPGVNNTKDSASVYNVIRETGGQPKAVDIDSDGDYDIVLSPRFQPLLSPLNDGLDFGLADLEGSVSFFNIIDALEEPGIQSPFSVPSIGQRILINRRNELVDEFGRRIPIGTPDPFIRFLEGPPDLYESVFNQDVPPDELASGRDRRIDKFWMRDESFGRDGLFGGGNFGTQNFDRLPPGYVDIPQTAPRAPGNRQDEVYDNFEVLIGHFFGIYGPDIYALDNRFSDFGGTNQVDIQGTSKLMINFDLLDENGVATFPGAFSPLTQFVDGTVDGYFYTKNYGQDFWMPLPDNPFPALIGARQGQPFDAEPVENGESTYQTNATGNYTGIVVDSYSAGTADIIVMSDNEHYRLSKVLDGDPGHGGWISRGQNNYSLGGATNNITNSEIDRSATVFADLVIELGLFGENEGRFRDIEAADMDRNGGQDLVMTADAIGPVGYNVLDPAGGRVSVFLNSTARGEAADWTSVTETAFRPTGIETLNGLAVAVFDADNDGDYDIVTGGQNDGMRIFMNESFFPNVPPSLADESDPEIFYEVTTTHIPNLYGALLTPEGPSFTPSGSTASVDSGDIDRNGSSDLVIGGGVLLGGAGGDATFVYRNHGPNLPGAPMFHPLPTGNPAPKLVTNAFAQGTTWLDPLMRPTSAVRFVDIDNDGDLDIFQANLGLRNEIFFNRDAREEDLFANTSLSDEFFNPPFYNSLTGYDTREVRVAKGDLGIEGYPVAEGIERIGFPVEIIANTVLGDGIFERNLNDPYPVYPDLLGPGNEENTREVAFGDINDDGRIDMYLCNGLTNFGARNILMLNKLADVSDPRSVIFDNSESTSRLPTVIGPAGDEGEYYDDTYAAAFSDVDNDGDVDLIVANSIARPGQAGASLVERSYLLLNDGDGFFTEVTNRTRWPLIERNVRAITVANFGRNGDITEDIDGNGIVTDAERQKFNNIVDRLTASGFLEENEELPFAPESVTRVPVTEVMADERNPNDTFVIQRPPRFINFNENFRPGGEPIYDPVYDIILWTTDGDSIYLANDGTGGFSDSTDTVFQDIIVDPVYDAEVGDIDLDGWLDIVVAANSAQTAASVRVLENVLTSPGAPVFRLANNEVPPPLATLIPSNSDPHGRPRGLELFDADGDGDLDLYVGEAGRTFGGITLGALDAMYENRVIGAGYNARQDLYLSTAPGIGPIVDPDLAITGISPTVGVVGQSYNDVRVFGRRFQPGMEIFFGQGVTVTSAPVVRSSEVLEVDIRIESTARPGPRQLFVINPDGETAVSSQGLFRVGLSSSTGDGRDEPTSIDGWQFFD